jgi:hypothetical protein
MWGRADRARSKPLVLISPWFGPWPEWINFFVESCKWNPEIDWLIPTDQAPPDNTAPNIQYQRMSFDAYKRHAGSRLGIDLTRANPYKLCDLKPCLGFIHEDDIAEYRSFGFCDIDIVWGDIRATYSDELLARYDAISSLDDRIAGHLSVFRNTAKMRSIFRKVKGWRACMEDPRHLGFDEGTFSGVFSPPKRLFSLRRIGRPHSLFVNRWATPGGTRLWPDGLPGPSEWTWKRGKLSNERDSHDLLYLHVMLWQSNRWRRAASEPAPWPLLDQIVQCDWREAAVQGFRISPRGIEIEPQGQSGDRGGSLFLSQDPFGIEAAHRQAQPDLQFE